MLLQESAMHYKRNTWGVRTMFFSCAIFSMELLWRFLVVPQLPSNVVIAHYVFHAGTARLTQRVVSAWSALREASTRTTDIGYDVIMM